MEADKHDGEDDSAVLVNITAPHPEYSVRRLRRRKSWKRKLNLLGMAVPDVMMVPGQGVVTTASDGAGHHAARVQLQLGLQSKQELRALCIINTWHSRAAYVLYIVYS